MVNLVATLYKTFKVVPIKVEIRQKTIQSNQGEVTKVAFSFILFIIMHDAISR